MPPRKRRSKTKYPQNDVNPACSRNEGYDAAIISCNNSRQHPIHIIPVEVLSEILILALDIDSTEFNYRSHLKHKEGLKIFNPLTICAICSSWRSLAFSIPQLWQRVFIRFSLDLTKAVAEERAAYLVQWIERSRSLPLALHISFAKKLSAGTGAEAILSVLDGYANRWETLYLQDDSSALRLPLRPSSMAPSTCFTSPGWVWSTRIFQQIYRYHYYTPPMVDPIPWGQLTHLRIHDCISCNDAKRILMKCQKLVELSIVLTSFEMPEGPVISNNLVALSLKRDSPLYLVTGPQQFLTQLAFPFLQDMCIDRVTSQDTQPLLNFLTQSSCALDKLEIRGSYLTSRDHLDILAHKSCYSLTSLTVFELEKPGVDWHRVLVDDEVPQRLTLYRDNTLCPHLKFLTFDCFLECSLSALLKMVESRIGSCTSELPGEPIHYLHFLRIRSHSGLQRLDEVCKASGMEYTRRRFHVDFLGHYFYSILLRR